MNHRLIPASPPRCTAPRTRKTPAKTPRSQEESRYETRYSVDVIDDATFYGGLSDAAAKLLNRVLVEPSFAIRDRDRWRFQLQPHRPQHPR